MCPLRHARLLVAAKTSFRGELIRSIRLRWPRGVQLEFTQGISHSGRHASLTPGDPRHWPAEVSIGGQHEALENSFASGHPDVIAMGLPSYSETGLSGAFSS